MAIHIVGLEKKIAGEDGHQAGAKHVFVGLTMQIHGEIIADARTGQIMGQGFFSPAFGVSRAPWLANLMACKSIIRKNRGRILIQRNGHGLLSVYREDCVWFRFAVEHYLRRLRCCILGIVNLL